MTDECKTRTKGYAGEWGEMKKGVPSLETVAREVYDVNTKTELDFCLRLAKAED